jgi:transposase-like protein
MNLVEFQQKFNNEQTCLDYLEHARWGNKAVCPHCGSIKTYKFTSGKLFKCGDCRKQFTAKIGTIFSDSKITLYKWFLAVYLATSLKKGISSIQLSKYIGVTQKTSWFMLQRIRFALEKSGNGFMLKNEIEVDETYIHPDPQKNSRLKKPADSLRYHNSQVVFGMVERGGRAKIKHEKSSGARVLLPQIQANIKPSSMIYSDNWQGYKTLPKLGYPHGSVNHSEFQFRLADAHTNNIEGFWSHLKRGIDGIYIHVSPKHLQKYCSEYEYRYNTRGLSDIDRFSEWFSFPLCRLTYKELIG